MKKRTWAMIVIAGILATITLLDKAEKNTITLRKVQQVQQESQVSPKKSIKKFKPDAGYLLAKQEESIKQFKDEAGDILKGIEEILDLARERTREEDGTHVYHISQDRFFDIQRVQDFLKIEKVRVRELQERLVNAGEFGDFIALVGLRKSRNLSDYSKFELPLLVSGGTKRVKELSAEIDKANLKKLKLEQLQERINNLIIKVGQLGNASPELIAAGDRMNEVNETVIIAIENCDNLILTYPQAILLWRNAFERLNLELRKRGLVELYFD